MAINFGILQNAAPPISTQVIQVPNYSAQNAQNLISGITAGVDSAAKMQEMANQRALLPGQIAQQGATLEQTKAQTGLLGTENKKAQFDLQNAQFQNQKYHESLNAYQQTLQQTGDRDMALDSMINHTMSYDPKAALTMSTVRQSIRDTAATSSNTEITNAAGALYTVQNAANPLETYQNQYKMIKHLWPDAPDPKEFKTSSELSNDVLIPALNTAFPFVKQKQMEMQMNQSDELFKAQHLVSERRDELKTIMSDPNASKEEKDEAAQRLQEAQAEVTGTVYGKGITGITNNLINKLPSISGMASGITNMFNKNQPQTQQAPVQQVQSSGQQAPVKMPEFQSNEDFVNWFHQQAPEVQADIRANPKKYGIQ